MKSSSKISKIKESDIPKDLDINFVSLVARKLVESSSKKILEDSNNKNSKK